MTPPPPPPLPPGTVLGDRFVIRRRLGAGGFGTVYLADQKVFDLTLRQVALKLFHQDLVNESNAREQLNEAAVLMRFQEEAGHQLVRSHLTTVLDAGFLPGPDQPGNAGKPEKHAFVAMEYVPGYRLPSGQTARTLQDMIKAFRPVPVDMALTWMTQILRAVAWMHRLQPPVLHCDLKPDNILPDGPNTLKVADFGLSQLAFGAIGLRGGAGALSCQAPETLEGVEPTPASDVYSLGLLMHEILAGESPLARVGLAEIANGDQDGHRHRQFEAREAGIAPLAEAVNPDLARHPLLTEIVGKCLRFHAPERYASAVTLLRDIEAYTAGQGRPTVSPRPLTDPAADSAADGGRLERLIAEAEALDRAGKTAAALDRAEAALAQFPRAVAAHACLARLHVSAARWEEAVRLCGIGGKLAGISGPEKALLYELSADAYDAGGQPPMATVMRDRAAAARKRGSR